MPRYSGTLAVSGGCSISTTWPASWAKECLPSLQEKYYAPADLGDVLVDPRDLAPSRLRAAGQGSPEETGRNLDGNQGRTRRQSSRGRCRTSALLYRQP